MPARQLAYPAALDQIREEVKAYYDRDPDKAARWIQGLYPHQRAVISQALGRHQLEPHQIPPPGEWDVWLLLAGRGAGKTEACADWIDKHMLGPPCDARIPGGHRAAIVAPTMADAWDACVAGPSGLQMLNPKVEAFSTRGTTVVRWPNGSLARLFGTHTQENVDRLRAGGNTCVAAGTPVLTRRGPVPVEQVLPGDWALTRQGWAVIRRRWDNGLAQVVRLTTTDGRVLLATPDHLIAAGQAWKQAGSLGPGSRISVWESRSSSTTGSAGTSESGTATTPIAGAGSSTATYGSRLTARSLLAGPSTTPTKTRKTTGWKTLSWSSPKAPTPGCTAATGPGNGTPPEAGRPAWPGELRLRSEPVMSVTGRTGVPGIRPTARPGASSGLGASVEAGPGSSASVATAGRSSPAPSRPSTEEAGGFALDSVVTVEPVEGLHRVYDLEVAGPHEYVAAGFVIHNCVAWCEELASWPRLNEGWEHLDFGLRLGTHPRRIASTTPKTRQLIKDLVARAKLGRDVALTRATTDDNPHLHDKVKARLKEKYFGTRIGRQELYAELLEDVEGALLTLEQIEEQRWHGEWAELESGLLVPVLPRLKRLGIGVDPPGGRTECGIVAAGLGEDGDAYVLDDYSLLAGADTWPGTVVTAYHEREADAAIAEQNYGGDMVKRVISVEDPSVNVRLVHATRGKTVRAEPIVNLTARHHIWFVGSFPQLEDQLTTWVDEKGALSPNRLDAWVWILWWLMVGKPRRRGTTHGRQIAETRLET